MKERAEQMFWVHTRGIIVSLPPDATESIGKAHANGEEMHPNDQRRLNVINNDGILKKRYPSTKDGEEYMNSIDMEWREVLYSKADSISTQIVEEAKKMGKEDIAILLFGSVAKGLVRKQDHADPSNIDLTIIGQFTDKEREELLNRIRPIRDKEREEIRNNVGVFIQTPDKLRNSNYGAVFMYIGSSARALYDPKSIWSNLQEEALSSQKRCKEKKQNGRIMAGIAEWMNSNKIRLVFKREEVIAR